MIDRIVALLPMVVGGLALGGASGTPALGAAIAAIALALGLVGERWELDRGRQIVGSALGGGVGYATATLLFEARPGHLGEWTTRVGAFLLLAAAARLVQVRPAGGRGGTVVIALLGMVACGQAQGRGAYPVFVVLFLGACLAALRYGEPGRPRGGRALAGRVTVGVAILAIAGGLGGGCVVGSRRAHRWMLKRAQNTALFWRAQVGFADRMELGALDGLLDSDTVVLRVRGEPVDYLRGATFDVYENGRWFRSERLDVEVDFPPSSSPPEPGRRTSLHAVSDTVDRFFLPYDARDVRPSLPARVDPFGVVKRATKGGFVSVDFLHGARDRAEVAEPTPSDLRLSRRTRADLTHLAEAWTEGATSTEEKLERIEQKLGEYRYSRHMSRAASLDPVTDFLFVDRMGHCEYFASAMALLARSLGIPARVATGYRVAEHNPYGGYWVVRERHAHAWVEAWVEHHGWVTRDPTPPSALPEDQPHEASAAAALADVVRTKYDDLTEWLADRTVGQTAAASAVGFVALLIIIARGARTRRTKAAPVPLDEAALPFLASLLATLERAGERHDPAEPLERLAERLADADAAILLRRYAALRYGGVGDADALAREMIAHVDRLRAERRAAGP